MRSCSPKRGLVFWRAAYGGPRGVGCDGAVWVVRGSVAGQDASVVGVVVGDGRGSVLADDVDVEINKALAADVGIRTSDAVG